MNKLFFVMIGTFLIVTPFSGVYAQDDLKEIGKKTTKKNEQQQLGQVKKYQKKRRRNKTAIQECLSNTWKTFNEHVAKTWTLRKAIEDVSEDIDHQIRRDKRECLLIRRKELNTELDKRDNEKQTLIEKIDRLNNMLANKE